MEFDNDDYHKSVSLITGFIFRYVCEFTIRITPKTRTGNPMTRGPPVLPIYANYVVFTYNMPIDFKQCTFKVNKKTHLIISI